MSEGSAEHLNGRLPSSAAENGGGCQDHIPPGYKRGPEERDARGRFVKGSTWRGQRPPRSKAAKLAAAIQANVTEEDVAMILGKLKDLVAKNGSIRAAKLILDHSAGKASDKPIDVEEDDETPDDTFL